MKCPYCSQEHPNGFKFCPVTAKKMLFLKACTNPNCEEFNREILPPDSSFCPRCGFKLRNADVCGVTEKHHIYSSSSSSNRDETIKDLIKKRELSQIISALMSVAHLK